MNNYIKDPLRIDINKTEDKVVMTWTGRSVEKDPWKSIIPYLDSLAENLKGMEVKIEFEELKLINTSTFTILSRFFKKLDKNGVITVATYNSKVRWQYISFKGIKALSSRLENVSVQGV
ncbi:MAG: hypothetical protein GY795_35045 [Desulfobacterales bacterium]|nr:hypothetical protein [Desulfobacterales bacterium]